MFKEMMQLLLPVALVAPALSAEWLTDLEAGKAQAARENKAVLVDFTGSDWCGWCIRLKNNVFDKPEFEEYAKDKLVLVEVDVPNGDKLSPEKKKENQELCAQFHINGFPTILVMTPEGQVAGGFVGGRDSMQAVKPTLDEALRVAGELKKAQTLEGKEKLTTLAAAYKAIPDSVKEQAQKLRDEIIALDQDDTTGLQREVRLKREQLSIMEAVQNADNSAEAIKLIDQFLQSVEPENRPGLYFLKERALLVSAESEADLDKAQEAVMKGIEMLPKEQADQSRSMIEARYKDKAALLQKLKTLRH